MDISRSCSAKFVCNALNIRCVASCLILFPDRFSVVNVCVEWRYIYNQSVDKLSYRISFWCIGQKLCTCITDLVIVKVQRCECLFWMKMMNMYNRWIEKSFHRINLQYTSQILYSFITNFILANTQRCERLCYMMIANILQICNEIDEHVIDE